jgi:serine phosphatase RsbU (regulator of sigma subunit)
LELGKHYDGVGKKAQPRIKLQYAGAHSPLIIYRGNECIETKADKKSIGFIKIMGKQSFTNHSIELFKGDMLYLFSDGYADQIGGPENKKIFAQPFRDLLQSICQLDISEQKKTLYETFINWKGKQHQTDDILVMGIRI